MVDVNDSTAHLVEEAREKLATAQADLEEAESRVENARERIEKYESFLSVLGEFTGNGVRRSLPDLTARDITIAEAAEVVLREAGKPLKNRQIAERMLAGGYEYDGKVTKLRNSVGTILDRKAGKNDTFVKEEPGVFGLLDWEQE